MSEDQSSNLVEISSLDTFVRILSLWHSDKIKVLEHMLDVPEGTSVQLSEEEAIILTGETHKAFIIGLNLALMELGVLPFSFETEEDDEGKEEALIDADSVH